jgi:hypothetical protein
MVAVAKGEGAKYIMVLTWFAPAYFGIVGFYSMYNPG